MNRRTLLRTSVGLLGAATALSAAACGVGNEPAGSGAAQRATIRAGTRTTYDPEAFKLITEDEQAKVTVETELIDAETATYGRKVLALAAADSLPDLMYVHPNFFSSVASRKILLDHEKIATQQKFDLKGIQKELIDSNRWTDGKLYAIPYSGVTGLVVVNNGLFKQKGIPLWSDLEKQSKWTWDGFRDTLRRLTSRTETERTVGMPEHLRGLQYLSTWIFSAGGEVFSKDMKSVVMDEPKTRQALEYLAELHGKDMSTLQLDEVGEFGTTSRQSGFDSGRIGMYFRASTEMSQVKPLADRGAQLGVAPVPRGPAARVPRGAANSWAITAGTKQPEAAFRALAAWHRDPVLNALYSKRNMFPARATQFDHPAFKSALYAWEDLEVERGSLKDVRIMATPDRFTEIDEQWGKLWPDALYGKRTVKDMLQEFVPFANNLLKG
jgi:multiple sugar transport system substrate-binding protein